MPKEARVEAAVELSEPTEAGMEPAKTVVESAKAAAKAPVKTATVLGSSRRAR